MQIYRLSEVFQVNNLSYLSWPQIENARSAGKDVDATLVSFCRIKTHHNKVLFTLATVSLMSEAGVLNRHFAGRMWPSKMFKWENIQKYSLLTRYSFIWGNQNVDLLATLAEITNHLRSKQNSFHRGDFMYHRLL